MVRVRIAPSPTGDPHVGTAYIALFNLCFARRLGGKLILRIEDTDQVRSTPASESAILESLRWLGLEWDEGPDIGGEYGPYRQSERSDIYKQYAEQLIDAGKAFYCYRSAEELEALRAERRNEGVQRALKQADLQLEEDEIQHRRQTGVEPVVRLVVPEEGKCIINDGLRGEIEVDWAMVDAQVLLKADGLPTYHLANVVDDHLMQISHVIRGEEWISSAPKHQLLYQYLGWEMPELFHMPLLRNPDKSKLSKRKNPTSIFYYRDMGFLPQALMNYLGRMGWSMPDEREKFSLQEMIEAFDIQTVSLGGPVFDIEKLRWLNGLWMRENLSPEEFINAYQKWGMQPEKLTAIIGLLRERVETFADVEPLASVFFYGYPELKEEVFDGLALAREEQVKTLQFAIWALEAQTDWSRDALYQSLSALAEAMGVKLRQFLQPLFVAMSGSTVCPPLFDTMAILGPDVSRARSRAALEFLGGVSKKAQKKLDKEFRDITANL
jgi:glutamyl-tRNA synthetase